MKLRTKTETLFQKRTSTRDYVACSVSGEFYFGRLDLVGKGYYGEIYKWLYYQSKK